MKKEQALLIDLEKQLQKMTPRAEKYRPQVEMKPGSSDARKLTTYSNKVNEAIYPIHLFSLFPSPSPTSCNYNIEEILTWIHCWKMSPVPEEILPKASIMLLEVDLSGTKNFKPPEIHDLDVNS